MIAFTLCSNNYLGKAAVLAETLRRHNPKMRFVVGLVDKPDHRIDYKAIDCEIVPVQEIGIADFEEMVLRYDLIDLNTAVKPFYFRYLFETSGDKEGQKVCYLDPDIAVYSSLDAIDEALNRASVVLTPHILSPIAADGKKPKEEAFLAFGLYNLGFCALRWGRVADELLQWWSAHLVADCRYDPLNGLFVDQAWMDLVPIFFDEVDVSKHPGLNAAYWNLHERKIETSDGAWMVNDQWPLVFFHFSNLAKEGSDRITKEETRFTLKDRPELRPLFEDYYAMWTAHEREVFNEIPCVYVEQRAEVLRRERQEFMRKHPLRWMISVFKRSIPKRVKLLVRAS